MRVQADKILNKVKAKGDSQYKIVLEAHSQGTIIQDNALALVREELGLQDREAWLAFGKEHLLIRRYGEAIHNSEHALPEFTERYDYADDVVYRGTKPLEAAIDPHTDPT